MTWGQPTPPQLITVDPASKEGVELLTQWYNARGAAQQAVDAERAIRDKLTKAFFPTPKQGTNKLAIPGDSVLKAMFPVTYELKGTPDQINNIFISFNRAPGDTGKLLADLLFREKVEINKKEYERLKTAAETNPNMKQFLDIVQPYVVMKKGMPQMKIVPAGAKDKDDDE